MGAVLILNNDQMGTGAKELGQKILTVALRKLCGDRVGRNLSAVVLFNGGVHLAVKDSFVVAELRMLEERGVDILPCGTCVDFFKIGDRLAFDHISNMDEILATLDAADKVITF